MTGPLVVTLELDPVSQERFERERAELFPPGRTQVGAHVTLFHALPPELEAEVRASLAEAARRPRFEVDVTQPYSLGRGVAYRLSATELLEVHDVLRARWLAHLTPQDRQPFRPHVTVQNKVSPDQARSTLLALTARFEPCAVQALGLLLWRYEGGPWTRLGSFPFLSAVAQASRRLSRDIRRSHR